METELVSLAKACILVPAALIYCHRIAAIAPPGIRRLAAVLPVIYLFILLPLSFTSIHLRGISAFFLTWLTVFKLLLFSLGLGPLLPHLSLPSFLATASLPILLKSPAKQSPPSPLLSLLGFFAKALILALIVTSYPTTRSRLHRAAVVALYSIHMYLSLDVVLAGAGAAARALLPKGAEMEPHFAAPYLSTSLQDFWGRRWNRIVPGVLRPAVYAPVKARWGTAAGVAATFVVSGVMHEVMYYYVTLAPPTGEVTWFFVLHGACTAAEIKVKRWWRERGMGVGRPVNPGVAAVATVGFLGVTGWWLFFPQILRSAAEEEVVAESEAVVQFLRRCLTGLVNQAREKCFANS